MIYLGGLGLIKSKVEALASILRPKDVSQLQTFVGLANYYRKFVANFSCIAELLTMFTRNDQGWLRGVGQEVALIELN